MICTRYLRLAQGICGWPRNDRRPKSREYDIHYLRAAEKQTAGELARRAAIGGQATVQLSNELKESSGPLSLRPDKVKPLNLCAKVQFSWALLRTRRHWVSYFALDKTQTTRYSFVTPSARPRARSRRNAVPVRLQVN